MAKSVALFRNKEAFTKLMEERYGQDTVTTLRDAMLERYAFLARTWKDAVTLPTPGYCPKLVIDLILSDIKEVAEQLTWFREYEQSRAD